VAPQSAKDWERNEATKLRVPAPITIRANGGRVRKCRFMTSSFSKGVYRWNDNASSANLHLLHRGLWDNAAPGRPPITNGSNGDVTRGFD
jgi:hypothetical protein